MIERGSQHDIQSPRIIVFQKTIQVRGTRSAIGIADSINRREKSGLLVHLHGKLAFFSIARHGIINLKQVKNLEQVIHVPVHFFPLAIQVSSDS